MKHLKKNNVLDLENLKKDMIYAKHKLINYQLLIKNYYNVK